VINEIKQIVQNYLNNAKLCSLMVGTVIDDGIRISDKLVLPDELIIGNLKGSVITGQKVRLLRNHGGQQFYILEVISE
jgi:cytoskeletal protein CcmA (bactofilin family)